MLFSGWKFFLIFCTPFQIDGNFGGTAGVVEMLLQSHLSFIHLLPALPEAWQEGSIKGILARGGFVIDIFWLDGQLSKVAVHSLSGRNCRIFYQGQFLDFPTEKGEIYWVEWNDNYLKIRK